MPQKGVSYEAVDEAANHLEEHSLPATARRIRPITGGSNDKINEHLAAREQKRQEGQAKQAAQLSPDMTGAILREIGRAVAKERERNAEAIARLQAQLQDAIQDVSELERVRDELLEEKEALRKERDMVAGRAAEQESAIEKLSNDATIARQAAEKAQIELSQVRTAQELASAELRAQRVETDRLREEVQKQQQGRTDAEREKARADSAVAALELRLNETREAAERRVADAQGREKSQVEVSVELRRRIDELVAEQQTAAPARARGQSKAHRKGAPAITRRARSTE